MCLVWWVCVNEQSFYQTHINTGSFMHLTHTAFIRDDFCVCPEAGAVALCQLERANCHTATEVKHIYIGKNGLR